jgi:hypothetical protein
MGRRKKRDTGTINIKSPDGGCVGKNGKCVCTARFDDPYLPSRRAYVQFINKSEVYCDKHSYKIINYVVDEDGLTLKVKRKD